ncbi:MAG: hypothetical protein JW807_01380 [Spirochaetes bacterium]|nr:hypothetical protein [Spirochaetota bacterium]
MDHADFKIVKTNDGSYTLYFKEYNEHMHSLSGAYEEALLKHVRPSGILEKTGDRCSVLDVGFGLGYNILALITELSAQKYSGQVSILSLEKERTLLPVLQSLFFNDPRDDAFASIKHAYETGDCHYGNNTIRVLFGDARESVRTITDTLFDAVFFDPFSPSRNPELWSVDFFRHIFRLMSHDAVLTTYSSAPQVRVALLDAGFLIGKGPSVGGKREGTLAAKTSIINPLSAGELDAVFVNRRAVPYRDENLSSTREAIITIRSNEIRKNRSKDCP